MEFQGVFLSVVRCMWSESADELRLICIFPLVRFGFTQAKCQGNRSVINRSRVRTVIPFIGLKLHLPNPLSVSRLLNISKRQRISSLLQSTFDSCLCHSKLLTVCLQSLLKPIMHSTAGYGSWFSPKMSNSSAFGTDQDQITFIPQTNRTSVGL